LKVAVQGQDESWLTYRNIHGTVQLQKYGLFMFSSEFVERIASRLTETVIRLGENNMRSVNRCVNLEVKDFQKLSNIVHNSQDEVTFKSETLGQDVGVKSTITGNSSIQVFRRFSGCLLFLTIIVTVKSRKHVALIVDLNPKIVEQKDFKVSTQLQCGI
jgi:hypothetical protein